MNITLIAVNKKAAVGEDTHYDLGNMKCIISPSNTGNYIFTVPHEAQNRIYDHFEQNKFNRLDFKLTLTKSAILEKKTYRVLLGYLNRVATKGNEEYGHVSTAEVYSSWI